MSKTTAEDLATCRRIEEMPKPTKKKFNIKKFLKQARKVRKTFTQDEIDNLMRRS